MCACLCVFVCVRASPALPSVGTMARVSGILGRLIYDCIHHISLDQYMYIYVCVYIYTHIHECSQDTTIPHNNRVPLLNAKT